MQLECVKLQYKQQVQDLPLERATEEMWKLSQKQYDLFSPGLNEWPALLRRCDAKDPSYKE